MKIKWITDKKPEDGQEILAKYKHGIIQCYYDKNEDVGRAYVWQDLEFFVYAWISLEEFNNLFKEME